MHLSISSPTPQKPAKKSNPGVTFFTTGYEQAEPVAFLRRLKAEGVQLVVDVRDMPLSRRKGFSKNQLQALLAGEGIDYKHLKPLGAPKVLRDRLHAGGSWWEYMKGYRKVLDREAAQLDALVELAQERRICLLCFERKPEECHRSLVAHEMEQRTTRGHVQVEHIRY